MAREEIPLRPDVAAVLRQWWLEHSGHTLPMEGGSLTDPLAIEKLRVFALPDEDLNDTILRIIAGLSSSAIN